MRLLEVIVVIKRAYRTMGVNEGGRPMGRRSVGWVPRGLLVPDVAFR
jgi:hypothetical protein